MFNIIVWTAAGILTMLSNDKIVLKVNYVITWIVLMFNLIANYYGV